ncbi:MAG TPA: hypothetical protein VGM72_11970 [Micropepsaceae bacterium]|jgi:hypothetical protein
MRKPWFFALVLAGCANDGPGDPNYDIAKAMETITQNAMIGYHDRCLSFGAEIDTPLYAQCVSTLAEADKQAEELREGQEGSAGERRSDQR